MFYILTSLIISFTPIKTYDVTLVECYDGDTCTFNIHLGLGVVLTNQRVRFCDINAAEIRPLITRKLATKIRDNVIYLIKQARVVQIQVPQKINCIDNCDKRGKYGRLLAYIILDNNNLNKTLLSNKLVEPWKDKCLQ